VSIVQGKTTILLHCGTNNVVKNNIPEIISKFENLITLLNRLNPNVKILISTILARPIDFDKYGAKCAELNQKLKTFCHDHHLGYVATHKITLKYGRPITDLYYDGIHLKDTGVRKLKQFLSQRLAEYGNRPTQLGFTSTYLKRSHWQKN
jgi:lysophospholipase L1-like esterase